MLLVLSTVTSLVVPSSYNIGILALYSHQILVGAKLRALCKFFLNSNTFTGLPTLS